MQLKSQFDNNSGFLSSLPPATKHLLIINVLVWLATFALLKSNSGIDLFQVLGLHYFKGTDFHVYQLFTYMFMHSLSFSHIFFNMFALWMFGTVLERNFGTKFFLFFYIVAGLGAGVLQELTWMYDLRPFAEEIARWMNTDLSEGLNVHDKIVYSVDELTKWVHESYYNRFTTVGASGSVFGLLAGFAMLFPNQPMYIMFIPIPIKAKYVMIGYAAIELFCGVQNFSWDNVAHFAHLGGAIVGVILCVMWKRGMLRF